MRTPDLPTQVQENFLYSEIKKVIITQADEEKKNSHNCEHVIPLDPVVAFQRK